MSWTATDRYAVRRAPGGLALVQDLLNTVAGSGGAEPDLLADLASAQAWLDGAVAAWAEAGGREAAVQVPSLGARDLPRLRELRARLRASVRDGEGLELSAGATLRLRADGAVEIEPQGAGWRWVASAILAECLLAQRLDTWRRVKACRNERCPVTFYDHSRNASGVWHDVRTCGNVANLRASRARRRAG